MPAFRGMSIQRGHGAIGGMFKGLAKYYAPVLKRTLLKAGKRALMTIPQVFEDVSKGKSLKRSIKDRSMQNLNSLGSTFMNEMNSPASKAARYEANQRDNIRRIHL